MRGHLKGGREGTLHLFQEEGAASAEASGRTAPSTLGRLNKEAGVAAAEEKTREAVAPNSEGSAGHGRTWELILRKEEAMGCSEQSKGLIRSGLCSKRKCLTIAPEGKGGYRKIGKAIEIDVILTADSKKGKLFSLNWSS